MNIMKKKWEKIHQQLNFHKLRLSKKLALILSLNFTRLEFHHLCLQVKDRNKYLKRNSRQLKTSKNLNKSN